jgi:hypothetical protein
MDNSSLINLLGLAIAELRARDTRSTSEVSLEASLAEAIFRIDSTYEDEQGRGPALSSSSVIEGRLQRLQRLQTLFFGDETTTGVLDEVESYLKEVEGA